MGHPFDGSPIQDDDLRQSFLPPVTNIIRKEDTVDQHTPILVELTEAEIDKIEKDRERDARSKLISYLILYSQLNSFLP